MKKLEREDKIPDNYRARRKRPTIVRRVSIISIIFVLWNSFAIFTWVAPFFQKYIPNMPNPSNRIIRSYNTNRGMNPTHQKINNYFNKCTDVNHELGEITNKINGMSLGREYQKENILSDINSLQSLKEHISTHESEFRELESLYLEKIDMTENMLINLYGDRFIYDQMDNIEEKWQMNSEQQRYQMVEILNRNGIIYEVQDDGTISYKFYR